MNSQDTRRNPERYEALKALVEQNVSINEIMRTLHMDHRTIKRHFPDYKPFEQGATAESNEIREANRMLNEFISRGKVQSNRDAGFNQRSDVL